MRLLLAIAAGVSVTPFHSLAQIVITTNDSGVGSLREAIATAASGSTVTFDPLLSGQTILLTSGVLDVTNSLDIDASALTGGIFISGSATNAYPFPFTKVLFAFTNSTTNTLRGLHLTNSITDLYGSIYIDADAKITLTNCTIRNSGSTSIRTGSGIVNRFGTLTLQNCVISGHYAAEGGGVVNIGGNLMIESSAIMQNFALAGGGIFNFDGDAVISGSTIASNAATDNGGGVWADYSLCALENCTIAANFVSGGGFGGGIYLESGAEVIVNSSTIFRNAYDGIYGTGVLRMTNSIVAINSGINVGGILFFGASNFTSGNPNLAPLGHYGGATLTVPPLPGSPVIDSGGPTPLTVDQRGFARVVGGAADIGAVEFQQGADLGRLWPLDWDGDGQAFGIEFAIGTSPNNPDTGGPRQPQPYPPESGNGISFGFNPLATNYASWVVKRSLDLSQFNSFVEIFRMHGPTGLATIPNGFNVVVTNTGTVISVVDNTMPLPQGAFYILTSEPIP